MKSQVMPCFLCVLFILESLLASVSLVFGITLLHLLEEPCLSHEVLGIKLI